MAAFEVAAQDITKPQTTAPVAFDAVQRGNWLVGADIGNISHNFKSETFSINIMPRAGFFISDNAAIGAQAQIGLTLYDGGENFYYGATPFVRYYFPEGAAPTHRWFGEALAGFAGSSIKNSEGDAILSSVFGLGAGYAHFVASNVALEGMLRFTRTNADISVGDGMSGLSLSLGLQVYLPGRGNR
ncbi:hypothetical protein AAE02nite_36880 [Adhaeribacter aerolatus]|uniref:Outer membrane protein beta-barrel domain-containing protein n=2 Tax=Adhaeribacter aerolatus TaxID=670289 RepID=A0A512B233_9BACT|nr:hypothetical protein AAE02nite_36880 [Adhaeribacter aerolatus]